MATTISTPRRDEIPEYADTMESYHQAFAAELFDLLKLLPLQTDDKVLDLACGDGVYANWMQKIVGVNGQVIALDLIRQWMQKADNEDPLAESQPIGVQASALQLPFDDDTFDLVWCAQSFCTLDDVDTVLCEMMRVVRPGGAVAVLENDTLHHLILPWTAELELAVRSAELKSLKKQKLGDGGDYIGRDLVAMFSDAGLVGVSDHVASFTRQAPLGDAARDFLHQHLTSLIERAWTYLRPEMQAEMSRLWNDGRWLDQPDFSVACLERLVWGIKPERS